ncbi:tyrosine-type recombinase/integrase [Frankia sp. AgB1.9]|uniref:tyrosine-type recombinase/integrase n=1 Tax=unclassified Frankia TaxID=2632575 RepID=UPI0027DD8B41|nr:MULTISPECIES: tyrosine-type recombinase/integrase [unclassified Frankia]MBL7490573.1 tyrosine-type recombinase/integrase [Frankia sp. AgW1.1]MBL7546595.1 tyrosine-type recombinase/integrase [Frankia sp. AgB1.9]
MKPFKQCWCRDPATGRLLRRRCPELEKKAHGKWYVRVEAPGADGKRRRPLLGPYDTEKAARTAITTTAARVTTARYNADAKIKFGAYADKRYAWRRAEYETGEGLKKSTLDAEHEAIALYLKPGMGHLKLVDVTDDHIRDLYAAMRLINREGEHDPGDLAELVRRLAAVRKLGKDGLRLHTRPISEARIRRVHAVLTGILNDALVLSKLIDANPADGVFRSQGKRRRSGRARPLLWTAERVERWQETGVAPGPVMVWTSAQAGNWLDFSEATGERLQALFHLDAYYGLRRGELVGLDRADLSLPRRRLHVRQNDVDGDLDEGKTENADRTVVFDEGTETVLRAELTRQARERLKWGEAYTDSGRVFTRENGEALRPANVSARFTALVARHAAIRARLAKPGWTPERTAGQFRVPVAAVEIAAEMPLPPIRFHDLRHGAATMLLAAGAQPKLVSDVLGHASVAFTSDVYAVVAEEMAEAAATAIAAFVPRRHKIHAVGASNGRAQASSGS